MNRFQRWLEDRRHEARGRVRAVFLSRPTMWVANRHITQETELSQRRQRRAIRELIDEGFLEVAISRRDGILFKRRQ